MPDSSKRVDISLSWKDFFAPYVVLSFPFFTSFFLNKAHIDTSCVIIRLFGKKHLSETKAHLVCSISVHFEISTLLTASSSTLQPAVAWDFSAIRSRAISARVLANCKAKKKFNNNRFLPRRQTVLNLQLFEQQDKEPQRAASATARDISSVPRNVKSLGPAI
jgi:hypothetical protein